MKRTVLVLTVVVILAAALFGASQETKPPLRQELVKFNYVRPQDVGMLLQTYLSRDGRINYSPEQNTITISDYSENVEKVLAAIKDLDVKQPDVLFTIQLVLASEDGAEKTDESLAGDPIIKELKSFLKYKNFTLLDTSLVRAVNERPAELTMGRKGEFHLRLSPKIYGKDKSESILVEVRLNQIGDLYIENQTSQKENAPVVTTEQPRHVLQTLIESNLTLKSGDKTVVGVSRTAGGEKGLILIISAKLID